jgi:hypothetical protein
LNEDYLDNINYPIFNLKEEKLSSTQQGVIYPEILPMTIIIPTSYKLLQQLCSNFVSILY